MEALVVMIAVSGAGKTTWLGNRPILKTQIVSLDELRGRACDDTGSQEATRDAIALENHILKVRCRRRLLTFVDDTSISEDAQQRLLNHAARHRLFTVAIVLDTPLQTCIDQNARRPHPVPKEVIHNMALQFAESVPATGPVPGFAQTRRIGPTWDTLFGRTPAGFEQAPWLV